MIQIWLNLLFSQTVKVFIISLSCSSRREMKTVRARLHGQLGLLLHCLRFFGRHGGKRNITKKFTAAEDVRIKKISLSFRSVLRIISLIVGFCLWTSRNVKISLFHAMVHGTWLRWPWRFSMSGFLLRWQYLWHFNLFTSFMNAAFHTNQTFSLFTVNA